VAPRRCALLLLLLWSTGGVEGHGGAGRCIGDTCFFLFAGGPWSFWCLRCFFSGSGDDSVSLYLLVFCERVGAPVTPLGVRLVPVAGFLGGGGLFFRSPVLWLAKADFFFLPLSVKVTADTRSSDLIRLAEFWAMSLAALPRLGVSCREGGGSGLMRWWRRRTGDRRWGR